MKSDLVAQALERMSRVRGVRGALVVDAEAGVPVLAELAEGIQGDAVAALATSLFRRTTRAAQTADFGQLHTLQLEAADGHVIVAGAGEMLVVVVAEKGAQLGQVRLEAHRAAESLQ